MARLREATAEDIGEVNGIGPATAAAVVSKLAQTPTSAPATSASSAPEPDADAITDTGTGTDPGGPVRVPEVTDDGPQRPS